MKKIIITLLSLLVGTYIAQAVTFNVQVPAGTQHCYVCGAFNNWSADEAVELQSSGDRMFTLTLADVASVSGGYKYLCGRSWDYVEKGKNGEEISDRTAIGNPDVVETWRNVPEYNIESEEITVNGIKRLIKVYLPSGYESSQEFYPVIYYNTVQQRFNNAGDDGDPGDYFFGSKSWNAQATMEAQRAGGGKAYIMVQICSFLGENTPQAHPDFIGSGEAAGYLNSFVNQLMPYVEGKWRALTGPENTTIVGADYGAIFSTYAALTRQDIFGTCVAMSPMLWINENVLDMMAASASPSQRYYLSTGSQEPQWMKDGARSLYQAISASDASVYFNEFAGGVHTDDSWGESFPAILSSISSGAAPASSLIQYRGVMSRAGSSDVVYTLYGGTSSTSLSPVGQLTYTTDYYSGSTQPVEAYVITNIIPASNKSKYYWNIATGDESNPQWLMSENKSLSFSSKKDADSWHNIAVLGDGTIKNVGAHSKGFTVVANAGKTPMAATQDFRSEATVAFPSSDKSFTVHYGSVNSASDMGALTPEYSVSDNCTEALITYDFNLNKVTVQETAFGDTPPALEFTDYTYTLYGGVDENNLQAVGTLTYTEEYCRKGTSTPIEAFVITNDIAASVKSNYYWNIMKEAPGVSEMMFASNNTVGFKNSKTEISWQNVAVLSDGSVENTAAHSKGFKVVAASGDAMMSQAVGHTVKADVSFPGSDKTFNVNFGSVNTASDMGAMTPSLSVGDNCIKATVTYDFNLNKVTVAETAFGDNIDNVSVVGFTASPAVALKGNKVDLYLTMSTECNVAITCRRDFTQSVAVNPVRISPTQWHIDFEDADTGFYTFTVDIIDGDNTLPGAAEINVRILPAATTYPTALSVNAYKDVDWSAVGRYKANFHTHTSQSFDTQYSTSDVVDKYKNAGYTILALTDHDANSYPWNIFSLYNQLAQDRDPAQMGMIAIPGVELSKDRRNNWSESTGGEFNHHNDFFTGRKGQEFMSLRESYAYTQAIGGMQIINHPGQYWNLSISYAPGAKNSPEWHAENFRLYNSLIGFEVYNQGNRRPNDRILWDQVLTINMPETPVWGYSCDDTHTAEQYFRNYQFMLMDDFSVDALKDAMRQGKTVFSYEYTGSGQDKAPHINDITIDDENGTITIDSDDADTIEWIYSTHRTNSSSAASTKSTVVGLGNKFDFNNYQGSYVRARLVNRYGETATQPFGFYVDKTDVITATVGKQQENSLTVMTDDKANSVTVGCTEVMKRITVINVAGMIVDYLEPDSDTVTFSTSSYPTGVYIIVAATDHAAYTAKIALSK